MNDMNSLSHTSWNCKYHIVFAPKYRRKVFYGEKRREIGEILRTLCMWKKVKIVEAEVCVDHVHMMDIQFRLEKESGKTAKEGKNIFRRILLTK